MGCPVKPGSSLMGAFEQRRIKSEYLSVISVILKILVYTYIFVGEETTCESLRTLLPMEGLSKLVGDSNPFRTTRRNLRNSIKSYFLLSKTYLLFSYFICNYNWYFSSYILFDDTPSPRKRSKGHLQCKENVNYVTHDSPENNSNWR